MLCYGGGRTQKLQRSFGLRVKMLVALICLVLQVQWTTSESLVGTISEKGRSLLAPPQPGMMPQLTTLDVKCARSGMTVLLEFDREFPGVIYSKGHFYDPRCNYVTIEQSGRRQFTFDVPIDGCGTVSQVEGSVRDKESYFENTIIIQNDALIQEEWDMARNIRCTWQHIIQKSVSSIPFKVYEPMKVPVQLDKRSVNTLMEIQEGTGPFSSPATGYVYMGDDTSIVIYVQDPSREFDANVISCNASSAGGAQVELLDSRGCLVRPDLLTQFAKTRKSNGVQADLMLYSYLKAFKIGESPEFVISCHLEVCEGECSEPCSGGPFPTRRRRQADGEEKPSAIVELQRGVVVVSKEQLQEDNIGCWITTSMLIGLVTLLSVVLCLSTLSCFLVFQVKSLRYKLREKQPL